MNVIKIDNYKKGSIKSNSDTYLIHSDIVKFLDSLPKEPIFDLVITSPPYNIGKEYEKVMPLKDYVNWQKKIIEKIYIRLKEHGSICWEVGNYSEDGAIYPLDIELSQIFKDLGMKLRNRIVWKFSHGFPSQNRFSLRYEVIMWYTKSDNYTFNLDPVRIPSKYPGKTYTKGPHKGQLSGNPLGKNPEDVWEIPNVKAHHPEKTEHPCQFPVGMVERLVLSLSNDNELVFDPFAGVASTGVAALLHNRIFWGCDYMQKYIDIGYERLKQTIAGTVKYRPMNKPIFDGSSSRFAKVPEEWKSFYGKDDEDEN